MCRQIDPILPVLMPWHFSALLLLLLLLLPQPRFSKAYPTRCKHFYSIYRPNNQYTLKWPSLDPHHLLSSFRAQYGNHSSELNYLDEISDMLDRTGLRHGYLTRPCLDPQDRGCPKLAPNYKSQPPDIAGVVANGCPSFAANILHWPRDLILGGQRCSSRNQSSEECGPNQRLTYASALQSLLLLRSPQELYRTVRFNDPYKHESWTLLDAQNALDQWRNELKHYLIVHNKAIAPNRDWKYYGFTDNSLRDLLTQSTVRVWFAQLAGAIILVVSICTPFIDACVILCIFSWEKPKPNMPSHFYDQRVFESVLIGVREAFVSATNDFALEMEGQFM